MTQLPPTETETETETATETATDFDHEYRDVDGLRLHALVGGNPSGPCVVLLAGFPQDARAWLPTAALLADRYRLIVIDLPGQGLSAKPDSGYDTRTMASHIHGLVQQLGVDRHSVVAHDIGAWAAFPYGLLYGDEIDSMAFLDAGIPGVTMPTSVSLDPATVWKTMHFAFHQVDGLPEILLSGHERDYVAWFLRTKSHAADAFTDDDIDRYGAALAEPGAVRAALAYYRAAALSGDQNRELLETRRFTMPVLGVSAEFGSIPDMAAALRPFADRVENVDHAVIAGSGHFIPDEQPAALSAALRAHLG